MALAAFDLAPRAQTAQLPASCRVPVNNMSHTFAMRYYEDNVDDVASAYFYDSKKNQVEYNSKSYPDNVIHNPSFMKYTNMPQTQQMWSGYNMDTIPISYRYQTRQFMAGPHVSSGEIYMPCVFGRDQYDLYKQKQPVSTAEMDLYNGVHFGDQQGFLGADTHS